MAIYVQCEGGSGVAQISLHCLDVVPGADRGDCVGVTQVVETGIWLSFNDSLPHWYKYLAMGLCVSYKGFKEF